MNPTICIVNRSKTVSDADVKRVLPTLQKQITRDFEPVWGWGAHLRFNAKKFDMKVIIKDTAGKGGYLRYHIKNGKPITYIFAKDIADSGEYTTTLSHELLEMIADPGVNLYAIGKFRDGGRRRSGLFGMEVCDPVESNYYKIYGVRVSDWVRPEWFEPEHKKSQMKMDYMGVIDAPFMLADGGYADVLAGSRWHTLRGRKANVKRVRHRAQARKQALSG
ncbi:MAG TPA: hypothetical protein VHD88_02055 [Pyrinomonadaceae bacterium]|nr:hypothetical protein [Pyrinomonadaceae bacterium]